MLNGHGLSTYIPTPNNVLSQFAIYDYRIQKFTGALRFSLPILRLRPSRTHIAISTYNTVEVARVSGSPEKVCSFETTDNPRGLLDFQANWLAFPGRTDGHVQLVKMEADTVQAGRIHILPAHSGPLSAVHLSRDGKLLATAGQKVWLCHSVNEQPSCSHFSAC